MSSRRSVRAFSTEPVDPELIENAIRTAASAITFLVGVQADELMRKGSRTRGGLFSGVRAVTGG